MKMKKTAGLSAILFLCLAVPAVAQEWVDICYDNEDSVWYLNLSSVEDHGSYVTGWVRVVLSDAAISRAPTRAMSYIHSLYGAAKGTKQVILSQAVVYDRNGKVIYSDNSFGQWQYCAPNTPIEMVWYALMKAAGVRY